MILTIIYWHHYKDSTFSELIWVNFKMYKCASKYITFEIHHMLFYDNFRGVKRQRHDQMVIISIPVEHVFFHLICDLRVYLSPFSRNDWWLMLFSPPSEMQWYLRMHQQSLGLIFSDIWVYRVMEVTYFMQQIFLKLMHHVVEVLLATNISVTNVSCSRSNIFHATDISETDTLLRIYTNTSSPLLYLQIRVSTLMQSILIYQGVHCCTKVCNLQ